MIEKKLWSFSMDKILMPGETATSIRGETYARTAREVWELVRYTVPWGRWHCIIRRGKRVFEARRYDMAESGLAERIKH